MYSNQRYTRRTPKLILPTREIPSVQDIEEIKRWINDSKLNISRFNKVIKTHHKFKQFSSVLLKYN